jgi:hypothetical protein
MDDLQAAFRAAAAQAVRSGVSTECF